MPTPASGQISLSDVALIVYNSTSAQAALSDSDVVYLAGFSAGQQIALSNLYNKPTAGNSGSTYNTPGSYSWIVVPYKTLTANVVAAGGAGGGYTGGQLVFVQNFGFVCTNKCTAGSGTDGGNTDFNGVFSYGGGGGGCCGGAAGSARGNNINANTGGGGAGGAGNTNPVDTNCEQAAGASGGAGGFAIKSWTKGVDGPAYGSTINFTVGAGGTSAGSCRGQAGGPGGNGSVYLSWS